MKDTNRSTRYFNKQHNRLIYTQKEATAEFWDDQWLSGNLSRQRVLGTKRTFVSDITQRYLKPEDGVILEGGCGTGQHVAALQHHGYQCIGVDYAQQTIEFLNRVVPELDVHLGDVRTLAFPGSHFAGYWSVGVIEHFWAGYTPIAVEMQRVIKPNGYLFLTFPYLSPLRRLKANSNQYPRWDEEQPPSAFYQFALDHMSVVQNFEHLGFTLVHSEPMLGLRAIKEELGLLNPALQRLYEYKGRSRLLRGWKFFLSKIATPMAGHMILLVFQRNSAR